MCDFCGRVASIIFVIDESGMVGIGAMRPPAPELLCHVSRPILGVFGSFFGSIWIICALPHRNAVGALHVATPQKQLQVAVAFADNA